LTYKPSKVLIIGSGPIIIGQAFCHSSESWNPGGEKGEWILAYARMTTMKKEHKS
jgi:hypothetical protein